MPSSCLGKLTDIYTIKVPNLEAFLVPCDSKLADNGWTVIQRRVDGSVDFNRDWDQYKAGFGALHGSFFIGLEKLHHMTVSQPYELYVYLEDFENNTRYAKYSHFLIGSENESYKINKLGTYSGNAGDSLIYHLNMKFSTPDRDNDNSKGNCASSFKSGWWYYECYMCNLNGQHVNKFVENQNRGIEWRQWHTNPLRFVQMMIRPQSN
ncbi:ficolin-1 [Drosophila montana]|uniref:ficolin-1 n=1 Tax=Drosophila montana TaxID=40370 RepID=UPI00313D7BA0